MGQGQDQSQGMTPLSNPFAIPAAALALSELFTSTVSIVGSKAVTVTPVHDANSAIHPICTPTMNNGKMSITPTNYATASGAISASTSASNTLL